MKFTIVTIFPEMITQVLSCGILNKAIEKRILEIEVVNLRDYTHDLHKTTDDSPYGGGPGMVMKAEPFYDFFEEYSKNNSEYYVIFPSPQGKRFNSEIARNLSEKRNVVFICGRYEGIDERVMDFVDEELSLGDFVVSGGELPALVMLDSISRFYDGVVGNCASVENDSFYNGLLDHSNFTRPSVIEGKEVPEVLLSGNHKLIDLERKKDSLLRTILRRPDLFLKKEFDIPEKKAMIQLIKELYENA